MARKERKYHYIYKITCLKNNRYYIGMHSTDNLNDGYFGGGKRIKNSVKKHGKDAHRKEILEFFENRELLIEAERKIVNYDLLQDPLCMNLSLGGNVVILYGERNGFFGKKRTDEHSRKMEEGFRKKMDDVEYVKRISKRISEVNRLGNTFRAKKHTEEVKSRIGIKNSESQKGFKNSQYGTRWITNGIVNKKIKGADSIPEGWKFGRV